MNRLMENLALLYYGLKDSVISWMLLIGILLVLMLIFRCFTSPMKLARRKMQDVSELTKEIIGNAGKGKDRTLEISPASYKKLERNMISSQRLALAYYYDNGDDLKAKSIIGILSRIRNSIEATRTERVCQDQRALNALMKNVDKQSTECLKLLSDY